MLSNTGYESWENPPEDYEEEYFDECYAEELRYNKKINCEQLIQKDADILPF